MAVFIKILLPWSWVCGILVLQEVCPGPLRWLIVGRRGAVCGACMESTCWHTRVSWAARSAVPTLTTLSQTGWTPHCTASLGDGPQLPWGPWKGGEKLPRWPSAPPAPRRHHSCCFFFAAAVALVTSGFDGLTAGAAKRPGGGMSMFWGPPTPSCSGAGNFHSCICLLPAPAMNPVLS